MKASGRLSHPCLRQSATAKERQGILTVDAQDPYSGTIYTRGTTLLHSPNLSPIAAQVINYLNTLVPIDPGITSTSNSYRGTSRFTDNSDKGSLRLDWQASRRDSLFSASATAKRTRSTFQRFRFRSMADRMVCSASKISRQVLGWTHTISSNQLLDVRLALSRTKQARHPCPSAMRPSAFRDGPTNPIVFGGLPTISISGGFSTLGRQSTNPQWQNPALLDPKVNYSYVLGRHSLKFRL